MEELEKKAIDIIKSTGKWSHLFIFGNPKKPYPTNFENDLNNVMLGLTSKFIQSEKIKAQIEENKSVLEMLKIHGTSASIMRVSFRIEDLEQQLKNLEQ